MIQVKNIAEQQVEHFDPQGNSLGFLTRLENLDLRVQIARENAIGYHLMFKGNIVPIMPDGRINIWPDELYDLHDNLLVELFKIQLNCV